MQLLRSIVIVILAQVSGNRQSDGHDHFAPTILCWILSQKTRCCQHDAHTMLECWNVGISTLYMISRAAILLIIKAVYIAWIDTPLLAPGVGHVFGIRLDGGPFAFCKDLLVHDAHRHPHGTHAMAA